MFGIDQQVQQTADAYRGKPQMLQQKYAQNQQLIDLLALQKLKSDKAEAARQMALSTGGKPPTIADQRESEALDNAKKEVVQEQAGVMQNKMQQMQDAQKKLMQSAGAPQMPTQGTPQPQQPPAAGLAGLPAPNIQGMAGGGIVAFDQGGTTGEEEARRAMEERRQQPPREEQRPSAPSNLQAGLARLTNIDPEAIRQSRRDEAARDANFNAAEVAGKRAISAEEQAFDQRNRLAEALISGAGYTSGAGAIANIGQTALRSGRNSMQQRHAMENQLIDMGPAARALGIKSGDTGYEQGIRGLSSGINSAVDLEKVGAMGAATSEAAASRLQGIKDRLAEMGEKRRADVLTRVEGLVTNDPQYKSVVESAKMAETAANFAPTPKNITTRDRMREDQSAVYNRLFQDKLRHHLSDAGNTGTAPPVATPAPVKWDSLPTAKR